MRDPSDRSPRAPYAPMMRGLLGAAAAGTAYVMAARGALTLDLGIGRRVRPLGPMELMIAAPPDTVFDVVAAPYLGRTPRAMHDKLQVWERGSDMVLAAHFTSVSSWLTTTTVETVRFERPNRVSFRLLRGPVPHAMETYELSAAPGGTAFVYRGELGTDGWRVGQWWGDRVAAHWERTVSAAIDSLRVEAERRARGTGRR